MNLLSKIYDVNPYDRFDTKGFSLDLQGWHGTSRIFAKLIDKVKPSVIFEIGSWKGQSAATMGKYIKDSKLNCQVLCIDTWLGGVEHLLRKDSKDKPWYKDLKHKNGYPTLYYQFLYNMVKLGLQDIVVPLPNTSAIAAKYLRTTDIRADLIYIDGSHDELDFYYDLVNYFILLNGNGIIFGDDYAGVKITLDKFCIERNLKYQVFEENFWIIG